MAKIVVSPSVSVTGALLRPNNATAYSIGDVIANTTNILQETFAVARVQGGSGKIVSASLAVTANQTSVTTGSFELWLFDTAVAAHELDNIAFTPTDADLIRLVGVLQFLDTDVFEATLTAGAGGNVAYMAAQTFLPLGFTCTALSQNLHATLVARNAYTPVALEQFLLRVSVEQD